MVAKLSSLPILPFANGREAASSGILVLSGLCLLGAAGHCLSSVVATCVRDVACIRASHARLEERLVECRKETSVAASEASVQISSFRGALDAIRIDMLAAEERAGATEKKLAALASRVGAAEDELARLRSDLDGNGERSDYELSHGGLSLTSAEERAEDNHERDLAVLSNLGDRVAALELRAQDVGDARSADRGCAVPQEQRLRGLEGHSQATIAFCRNLQNDALEEHVQRICEDLFMTGLQEKFSEFLDDQGTSFLDIVSDLELDAVARIKSQVEAVMNHINAGGAPVAAIARLGDDSFSSSSIPITSGGGDPAPRSASTSTHRSSSAPNAGQTTGGAMSHRARRSARRREAAGQEHSRTPAEDYDAHLLSCALRDPGCAEHAEWMRSMAERWGEYF